MDEDFVGRLFQSKIVVLLVIGIVSLVVSRFIRRSRSEEEPAGVTEKVLWAGGLLVTLAAVMYAGSRGCVVDVPEKKKEELQKFSREAPGCSKPKKQLEDFKR